MKLPKQQNISFQDGDFPSGADPPRTAFTKFPPLKTPVRFSQNPCDSVQWFTLSVYPNRVFLVSFAMSPPQDYRELCRLCASYDDNKLDIFSDSGKQRNLMDKITSCLSFEVNISRFFLAHTGDTLVPPHGDVGPSLVHDNPTWPRNVHHLRNLSHFAPENSSVSENAVSVICYH